MQGDRTEELVENEYRVVGPPGCGKTTWLGTTVDHIVERGGRPLITSLTKAAAAEIGARKLPISFDALGTLHSHCYHALGQPEIAEGREHLEQWNDEQDQYLGSALGPTTWERRSTGTTWNPARGKPEGTGS